MSALNIKDPEAHRLAADLAHRTGQTITEAVIDALRQRSFELELIQSRDSILREARSIIDRVKQLPDLDTRSQEEILGYNRFGAFDPDGD